MAMPNRFTVRLWIVALVLLGGTVALHAMSHGEPLVPRQPLVALSRSMGDWTTAQDFPPLDTETLKVLGVTDYVNRVYSAPHDMPMPVEVYIGYYASQRTGDTIHSPKNCLPGSGWDPIHSGYASISAADGRQITVNEYVVANGLKKDLVFYWYQEQGRVIASEYWGKFWMIRDAITSNRTDGALVRLITQINGDDLVSAHDRLEKFTKILFPGLSNFIPN